MYKKAIEFSFGTLLGLAMILFLVVVLLLVFSGKVNLFFKSNECTAQGGYCTLYCEYATVNLEGCNEREVCCLKPS